MQNAITSSVIIHSVIIQLIQYTECHFNILKKYKLCNAEFHKSNVKYHYIKCHCIVMMKSDIMHRAIIQIVLMHVIMQIVIMQSVIIQLTQCT